MMFTAGSFLPSLRHHNRNLLKYTSRAFSKFNLKDEKKGIDDKQFNPFSVRLESNAKEQPSAISRIKSFFSSFKKEEATGSTSTSTVDDIYQNIKKQKSEESKEMSEKDKSSETEKRSKVKEMIDKNINRKYFQEKKLEEFFNLCFSMNKPEKFYEEDPKFNDFVHNDLKMLV